MGEFDLIIIGAGIAGLTSAIYARRAGLNVLIIECDIIGGKLNDISLIDNYTGFTEIGGLDLATRIFSQARKVGILCINEKVSKIESKNRYKIIETGGNTYISKSIIIATGSRNKQLECEGANLDGVSYCAICDGTLFSGDDVIVIGSGNTAAMSANYLSNIVNKLTMVVRGPRLKCDDIYSCSIKNTTNIEIIYNSQIKRIKGNKKVEYLELEDGREIKASGVFVNIGQVPNKPLMDDLETDEKGYIVCNENMETNIDGIFAVGDCRSKSLRQLITSASDGAIAACNSVKYCSQQVTKNL